MPRGESMTRFDFALGGQRIHLAVEGSTGGTTLGLHVAADAIQSGERVLWASADMPDGHRFSQLFSHLSLIQSSRFHAMHFGGRFDRAIDALLEASLSLPSVSLVVLDDWCSNHGRIERERLDEVKRFIESCPETISVLLISKGSIDASGSSTEHIIARSEEAMRANGFAVWRLWRAKDGPGRTLDREGEVQNLTIDDSGYIF